MIVIHWYIQFKSEDGKISKEETLNYFFLEQEAGLLQQLPLNDIDELRAEADIEFTLSQDLVESRYVFLEEHKEFIIKEEKTQKKYTCIQDEITHLEFVITFYKIDVSKDIINEKYKKSEDMIDQFIDGYCKKIGVENDLAYVRMSPNKEFMIISKEKKIK